MAKALLTKRSPFYVQFYVSNVCYLKCKMCNIVEANADIHPFKTENIGMIADNLVKVGAGVVLLTGGEPFLRDDIDEIVRIFKSRGLDIRLQTAGLYSKREKIRKCVQYGARDINVSLDSLDERLSDYINGAEGSWRNAIRTISFISRTFPRSDSICALGCVMSSYNIDEIEAVLDFATQIGWWLSLVPVHITNPDAPLNFRGYDELFSFNEKDFPKIRALIERLKKKKREGAKLFDSDDYLDSVHHFITTGSPDWRHKGICDSPYLYFVILPDGRFAPCCDYKLKEDIYVSDPEFPKIFKSREFREKVRSITHKCSGCNFGSFPEITLSARSFSTIRERVRLQFKARASGLKPVEEDELFETINMIKRKYNVYGKEREFRYRDGKKWPKASNIPQRLWNDRDGRE